ncbi:hypothetical protein GCM10010156_63110 [Planobispora rosea]|nr:hypothetical protein GCM10010156_63110 [Planobispora rosea]
MTSTVTACHLMAPCPGPSFSSCRVMVSRAAQGDDIRTQDVEAADLTVLDLGHARLGDAHPLGRELLGDAQALTHLGELGAARLRQIRAGLPAGGHGRHDGLAGGPGHRTGRRVPAEGIVLLSDCCETSSKRVSVR